MNEGLHPSLFIIALSGLCLRSLMNEGLHPSLFIIALSGLIA
jgi:hypothetical protein